MEKKNIIRRRKQWHFAWLIDLCLKIGNEMFFVEVRYKVRRLGLSWIGWEIFIDSVLSVHCIL